MRPVCIIVVEEVLPEVRRALANDLYRQGMSQEVISDLLGVSQAMVSKYLKESPERRPLPEGPIAALVRNLSAYALQGAGPDEMTALFCRRCQELMGSNEMKDRYVTRFPRSSPVACGPCGTGDMRGAVLDELTASARFLTGKDLDALIPAVKMNMAQCTPSAADRNDVASFPGRLQDLDGRIRQILPPQFGASRHLAGFLLEAHFAEGSVQAVINTINSPKVKKALEIRGLACEDLIRNGDGIESFRAMVGSGIRVLADPGDFGIEPCLYILGSSSLELARTVVELQGTIYGMEG